MLHSFSGGRHDGGLPSGELIESSPGVFVRPTGLGGKADVGTIFQMLADGKVTLLNTFTASYGLGATSTAANP